MKYGEEPPVSRSSRHNKSKIQKDWPDRKGKTGAARFIRAREGETRHAACGLFEQQPMSSAKTGLLPLQKGILILVLVALILFFLLSPVRFFEFIRYALWMIFSFAIGFRIVLLAVYFWPEAKRTQPDPFEQHPDIWPVYTLLLPLYREAKILPNLVQAISKFNYPSNRLDIKLLLEDDDKETIATARQLQLGANWEVIIVPDIGPRTKPKALNVGLARAKGSFVTIYDAEDQPHPDQLQAAVRAFAADPDGMLACVQAPLGYYNAGQNWLTRQFSLEYNAQFRVILPALVRLGVAFPLGGTSNHFRRLALDETCGWDPYNVTEDADLGFRLAEKGWRSGVISPPTMEEATAGIRPWVGQRSRWIKGFVQTLMVHLRGGIPGGRVLHGFGFFSVLGLAVFSAFSHAFLLFGALLCLFCWPLIGPTLSAGEVWMALTGTGLAWILLWVGSVAGRQRITPWLVASSVLYWPLQTWAALRAAIELVHMPFHWEKTEHGHSLDGADSKDDLFRGT